MKKDSYLCIGHVCMDKTDTGYVLGGTASYASKIASELGYQSKVLTSYGDDFQFENKFEDVEVHCLPATLSTVFLNSYIGDVRTQKLLSQANVITLEDFTKSKLEASIVHFSPIADEIDYRILDQMPFTTLSLATPQGWMRQWDGEGVVTYKRLDWQKLSNLDFVIISEEDVQDLEGELSSILPNVKNLIVTKGSLGADYYYAGDCKHYPSYPSSIVDPTGAGDTFATAFITQYLESNDVEEAMIFAHCLSSICIEHIGTNFLNKLGDVNQRVQYYKDHLLGFQP